jgi:hypothetical protein
MQCVRKLKVLKIYTIHNYRNKKKKIDNKNKKFYISLTFVSVSVKWQSLKEMSRLII